MTNADGIIAVSPKHTVKLAPEYLHLINNPPCSDFVVRTLAQKSASQMQLMSAELVIAGRETREVFPLAKTYPLHFRKSYFPGSFHGDPAIEFDRQQRAHELIGVPPPIGHTPKTYRGCYLPGRPYNKLSPFGVEPEEQNIAIAQDLSLATATGLWKLMEEAFNRLQTLHAAGFLHNDVELHNLVVCPSPLELLFIDFERAAITKPESQMKWLDSCANDLRLILREAVFLQCNLGIQPGSLAECSVAALQNIFEHPERFQRAIYRQTEM